MNAVTDTTSPLPGSSDWVHAEPFRRQLLYLSAATQLGGPVLAVVSRVPIRTIQRLLSGARPGRIRVKDARRLMALNPDQIRCQMRAPAEAVTVREALARLVHLGASVDQIAALTHVSRVTTLKCLAGDPVNLNWVVLWRAQAAALTWVRPAREPRGAQPWSDHRLAA